MLKLENVSKTYGRRKKRTIDGLSFEVAAGEVFALVGTDRAALTAVTRMIAGATPPEEGQILIRGRNSREWPVNCRRSVGYAAEAPRVYRWMTGPQWLDFIADVYGMTRKEKHESLSYLTDRFGIAFPGGRFRDYPPALQQTTAVAAALLPETPLVVLDGIFGRLDGAARTALAQECRVRAERGGAVFFTADTLAEGGLAADRIGLMAGGRLIAVGTERELRDRCGERLTAAGAEALLAAPPWEREVEP